MGGAADVDYRPRRITMRLYLHTWRVLARLTGMAQGPTQFCRKSIFEQVGVATTRRRGLARMLTSMAVSKGLPGKQAHSPIRKKSARATFLPSL